MTKETLLYIYFMLSLESGVYFTERLLSHNYNIYLVAELSLFVHLHKLFEIIFRRWNNELEK